MSLGSLPPELVLHIASFVGQSGHNNLSRTCKGFNAFLDYQLYYEDRKGAREALRWGSKKGIIGTVIKARKAGDDLDKIWQKRRRSWVLSADEIRHYGFTRPKHLRFSGQWFRRTALIRAIRNGHHDVARYIIEETGLGGLYGMNSLTIEKTNWGNAVLYPIHHIILAAAEAKRLDEEADTKPWQDLLIHVLQKGVNPNMSAVLDERPLRSVTALGLSLQSGCPWEITEILLKHGVDPTAPTGFWVTPDGASCHPFQQAWQLLTSDTAKLRDLVDSCKKVSLLLRHIPDLNDVYVGKEPLLVLLSSKISFPHNAFLRTAILGGREKPNPNIRDAEGTQTPLTRLVSAMIGTDLGRSVPDPTARAEYIPCAEQMLETLLRAGADPNAKVPEGPPLHRICASGRDGPRWDGLVGLLVRYGARLDATTTPGAQPNPNTAPLQCPCLAPGRTYLKGLGWVTTGAGSFRQCSQCGRGDGLGCTAP